MKIILVSLTAMLALLTANILGQEQSRQHNPQQKAEASLRGRDFVRLGEIDTFSGIVTEIKGEWCLITADAKYELHLGDHNHREKTGIKLSEHAEIKVTGFVYSQEEIEIADIAVCIIIMDGKEYRFRDDDGTPLWQGRGQNRAHNK